MYSYEDRVQAVRLYLKLGKRIKATIRQLGYRRIRAALSRQQVLISEMVGRRLMRKEGLAAATTRRRRYGSYREGISPAPENLINRDFHATTPNQKWLTDITEFQLPAGKAYLSPVIDCFDGLVVSWSISTRQDAELVNAMLDSAIESVVGSDERPVVTPIVARIIVGRDDYPDERCQACPVNVTQRMLAR